MLQVCQELATSTAISKARPNYISKAYASPSDEFYGQQWGLQAIEAEAAWEIETGHPDVIIAIVDSGVDLSHEDLKDKILPGIERYDEQDWLSASKDNDFIEYGRSQLMTELNVLQINFSSCIEAEILWSLHTSDLSNERVTAIQELINAAGGDKLTPVYELSQEEIMQDKYGFARAFKLSLKPETDLNQAIEILQCSPFVESVRPVGIQRIF